MVPFVSYLCKVFWVVYLEGARMAGDVAVAWV